MWMVPQQQLVDDEMQPRHERGERLDIWHLSTVGNLRRAVAPPHARLRLALLFVGRVARPRAQPLTAKRHSPRWRARPHSARWHAELERRPRFAHTSSTIEAGRIV